MAGDELLPAIDVVGRAREGLIDHDMDGERSRDEREPASRASGAGTAHKQQRAPGPDLAGGAGNPERQQDVLADGEEPARTPSPSTANNADLGP